MERLRAAFRQVVDLETPRARARDAMVRGAMALGEGQWVVVDEGRRGRPAMSLRSFFQRPAK